MINYENEKFIGNRPKMAGNEVANEMLRLQAGLINIVFVRSASQAKYFHQRLRSIKGRNFLKNNGVFFLYK